VTAVIVWYSTVTIYVAIRGGLDIKHMLRNLSDQQREGQKDSGKTEEAKGRHGGP
jgi:hypothetical protein